MAVRYQRPGEPLDDLFQVACVALIKAVDRFDPDRGVTFSSYAVPTMAGELKRYRRDHAWAVHVPRSLQELVLKVEGVVDELSQSGRSPTPNDVSAHLDIPIEDVLSAMEAGSAFRAASLDAPRRTDDGELRSAGDWLGDEDPRYELVEHDATLTPALKELARRERLILHLRFVEDMSQSEIARRIGVSQMQVSRLIRQTLARLRETVSAGLVPDGERSV
jgi:RNA polymerase sigma-B factor